MSQTTFTNGTASGTIEYTNDTIGLTQVLVSDGGAGQEIYQLYGNSLIGQQIDGSSQFQAYIVDGLGSVRVERETSGATNYTRTFSPFGETLSETGTSSSVYGYTGQQEDDSTGLIYLRARYYSAELKAFTAYDVWPGASKRPQSLNHYAYTEGNPVLYSDPTGNWIWRGLYGYLQRGYEHREIERWYETNGHVISLGMNPDKQIEYHIRGRYLKDGRGKRPDMFNSSSGEIWEIEPITKAKDAQPQARGYIRALDRMAELGRLTIDEKSSNWRGNFGNDYNWNSKRFDFTLGKYEGDDWPGRYSQPHEFFTGYNLVADKVQGADGAILYWLEPNRKLKVLQAFDYSDLPYHTRRLVREPNFKPTKYNTNISGEESPIMTLELIQEIQDDLLELLCPIPLPLPIPVPVP